MWRRLALFNVLCLLLLPSLVVIAQDPPPGAPSEIQQLRRTLLDQLGRLDALEGKGAAVDPKEIASLKALLEETGRRIAALEASRPTSLAPLVAGPPPSQGPTQAPVQTTALPAAQTPDDLQAEASLGAPGRGGEKGPSPEDKAVSLWGKPYMPTFYGSLKPRFGFSSKGQAEVGQSTSRLGLDMSYPFAGGFVVFARYELGINMTKQDMVIVYPEHGPPQGQGKEPVYTRLGYAGVSTPWGSVSAGKMYSPYYDIAGWTDQFYMYGADASGAFGEADGGIAGTGRASTAVQYRLDKGWFHLGFQTQHRNSESNDAKWYDTVGGSLRFDLGRYWTVGAAYQEVRDGVANPMGIHAKAGDKAFIAGFRFKRGPWYVAANYSDTRQNQKDDEDIWFDARGYELAVIYTFNPRWGIQAGYNYLEPLRPYTGLFSKDYALLTVTYTPHKNIVLSGEFRFDNGANSDGKLMFPSNVLVLGIDFGW